MASWYLSAVDTFPNLSSLIGNGIKNVVIKDINGVDKLIGDYFLNKKAIIFVNVASECGLTDNHYRELVEIHEKYKNDGLEILGFPCNQFAGQESKCEIDIKNFTRNRFKVEFPLFSKIDVNGPNTHELYLLLKANSPEFNLGEGNLRNIPWNFAKFLVNSEGEVLRYYEPLTQASKMIPDIEEVLYKI